MERPDVPRLMALMDDGSARRVALALTAAQLGACTDDEPDWTADDAVAVIVAYCVDVEHTVALLLATGFVASYSVAGLARAANRTPEAILASWHPQDGPAQAPHGP